MADYLGQDTEIEIISKLIPSLSSKTFLDIGAEKGSFSEAMLNMGMTGVLFEPLPRNIKTIQRLLADYPDAKLLTCAITDSDGFQNFNIAFDEDGNELDFFHSLITGYKAGVFSHKKAFEVECRCLQSLLKDGSISDQIGILKTDTEGNDLRVLRGLGTIQPEIIVCEYFSEDLYSGWDEGAPWHLIEEMKKRGGGGVPYIHLCVKRIVDVDIEILELNTEHFHENQYGNLLFIRKDFFDKTEKIVAKVIHENELKIINKIKQILSEMEAKEAVIKELDFALKDKRYGFLNLFFKKLKLWAR